jgi:hypothetical protein
MLFPQTGVYLDKIIYASFKSIVKKRQDIIIGHKKKA